METHGKWERLHNNQPPAPNPMDKLAFQYHIRTELFDRTVCRVGGQPVGPDETRRVCRHAHRIRRDLINQYQPVDTTRDWVADFGRAIRSVERIVSRRMPHGMTPHSPYSPARYQQLLDRWERLFTDDGWPNWDRIHDAFNWAQTGEGVPAWLGL